MSKANEQTWLTLAVITDCLNQMLEQKCLTDLEKPDIEQALQWSLHVEDVWSKKFDDDSTSNTRMESKLSQWRTWMSANSDEVSCGGLTSAAFRLCSDLEEKFSNKVKKKLIGELKIELYELDMVATRDGSDFTCIEEGNFIVDKLQELLEWTDTNFIKPPKELIYVL